MALGIRHSRPFVGNEPDDFSVVTTLIEGAREVHDRGQAYMRQCASRAAGDRAERRRPPGLPDYPVYSGCVDYSKDGTHVLRVFDPVQHDQQQGRPGLAQQGLES